MPFAFLHGVLTPRCAHLRHVLQDNFVSHTMQAEQTVHPPTPPAPPPLPVNAVVVNFFAPLIAKAYTKRQSPHLQSAQCESPPPARLPDPLAFLPVHTCPISI
jgi:hypothetical protein